MNRLTALLGLSLFGILLIANGQDAARPTTLTGKVVGVHDGDTLTLLVDKTQFKIRLEAIDAPELGQPFGTKAKTALSNLVFQKTVAVETTGTDKYGRTLGWVLVAGANVNEELLLTGYAWHYKKYNSDRRLAELESRARVSKIGLWADPNPLSPDEYRARQKGAGSSPSQATASESAAGQPLGQPHWLNTSSNTRHNRTCTYFNNTKRGRFCGPNEGRPCGTCGG